MPQHQQVVNLASEVPAEDFDRVGVYPAELVIEQPIDRRNPQPGVKG